MKKELAFLLVCMSVNLFAQRNTAAVRLGTFAPAASDAGFIIGFEGGRSVDEVFSYGWSIDWYHKNYVDKQLVNDFNQYYGVAGGAINQLRAETNLNDLPVMATMNIKFPVAPFTKIYFTGGVGAEVLIINYNNFENPDEDDLHAAFDFNWRISTGIIYEVGRFTDILFELTYHYSHPSWEYEVEDSRYNYKRTFERSFDMSGVMARFGVKFYY
jgi:hypothetical protein